MSWNNSSQVELISSTKYAQLSRQQIQLMLQKPWHLAWVFVAGMSS